MRGGRRVEGATAGRQPVNLAAGQVLKTFSIYHTDRMLAVLRGDLPRISCPLSLSSRPVLRRTARIVWRVRLLPSLAFRVAETVAQRDAVEKQAMSKTSPSSRPHACSQHNAKQVQIDLYSAAARIDPAVPVLEPYLEYRLTEFKKGGPLGFQQHEDQILMWMHDFRERMCIPSGLVPRVSRILTEHGYQVDVHDHRRFKARFAVDEAFLGLTAGDDRRLLDAVRREPLGQIEIEGFKDLIATMRLIISMYPKACVLIPVATKALARKIHHKLAETADFAVQLFGGAWPEKLPRCMVCTFSGITPNQTHNWDIILLADAAGAAGTRSVQAMSQFHGPAEKENHRVYSFLLPGLRLGRRGRLRLESMAGETIYRLAPQRAGVRVLWLPTPSCRAIDEDATALAFKRKAYWHNDRRNDYVAAVARVFASPDPDKLRRYGVRFQDGKPVLRNAPDSVTMVVVAFTEQGRELAKRLPGWKLFDAVPGGSHQDADTTALTKWIVTETRAAKHKIDVDVLIRAGASTGTACLEGLQQQANNGDQQDVLLVDFNDQFDPRAIQDSERRRREYELLGWDDSSPVVDQQQ